MPAPSFGQLDTDPKALFSHASLPEGGVFMHAAAHGQKLSCELCLQVGAPLSSVLRLFASLQGLKIREIYETITKKDLAPAVSR